MRFDLSTHVRLATRLVMLLVLAVVLGVSGCLRPEVSREYRTVAASEVYGRVAAVRANKRGLALAQDGDYVGAEAAFREALRADLSYPAAHNNLGLVLLEQRRFYEAAWEFSMAAKLDPVAVEPVMNLARLYESVGWRKEASEEFGRAVGANANEAHVVRFGDSNL